MVEIEISKDVFLSCYHHLIESDADINFLWGGRNSGKSHFIAQILVKQCLEADYFRCILIKKTFESIKDAQFQMIKDIVYEWGLESLFHFTESPLAITCNNGNKFIARGCDKPGKVKSIANPSHAWYEEGNQLSEQDYITVSTTLRAVNPVTGKPQSVKEWFSFNPECKGDYENFWLYKNYFQDVPYYSNTTREKKIQVYTHTGTQKEIVIKYTSTHTTYKQNPFCSELQRARLEDLQASNSYYYDVFTLGRWGKEEVKRPFAINFKPAKHVSDKAIQQETLPITFKLDFNVEPFVCEASHIWTDNKGDHWHVFDEIVIEKNGDVHTMCDMLEAKFGMAAMANAIFTGDAMQRKREITQKNNLDAWRIIDGRFRLGRRLQVPKANPKVKDTRHLINALFSFHPDLLISPNCKKLIYDLQFCEVDETGEPIKSNRGDEKQRWDALDCFRYGANSFLRSYLVRYNMK